MLRTTRSHVGSLFGLEDHPLDTLVDGLLDEDEQASHVHVLPTGRLLDRVRAPHTRIPRRSARKSRQTLIPLGLRMSCWRLLTRYSSGFPVSGQVARHDAAQIDVGRCLVHPARDVGARRDADHVAAGRDKAGVVVRGVEHPQPRVVDGGVRRR